MNNNMMSQNERKKLERDINVLDFTITELRLYLDTHPYDKDAISYFQKYALMRQQAMTDYTMKFGSISANMPGPCMDEWNWAKESMPWEGGCC